jgi:hypothetical protein
MALAKEISVLGGSTLGSYFAAFGARDVKGIASVK